MNLYFLKLKYNLIIIIIFFSFKSIYIEFLKLKKKIGVIGLAHSQNIGNNLLKYAIFIKLSELGYSPYIVGRQDTNQNISFITNAVNIRLIDNFSDIKQNDFDILIVNSDQTWKKWDKYFYDIAFLKFAENWTIPKFTYGVSTGLEYWEFNKEDEQIAKHLLTNFSGISVREENAVELIENHLGFKAQFVLDPTLLIEKKYYINLIKNFKSEIGNKINNEEFIFVYTLSFPETMKNYLSYIKNNLNTKIFFLTMGDKNQVLEFIYGIYNCKAVITDSFHGTIFSILFKKPFITFILEVRGQSRLKSLDRIFNIKNRLYNLDSFPPLSLLNSPLIVNTNKLKLLKRKSINYLKRNLNFQSY